jgi:hypothetical protein
MTKTIFYSSAINDVFAILARKKVFSTVEIGDEKVLFGYTMAEKDELTQSPLEMNLSSLSAGSRSVYERRIKQFVDFASEHEGKPTATVLLEFVNELASVYCASTLWSILSMVKRYLELQLNFSVELQAPNVGMFLKNREKREEKKRSSTFSMENLNIFVRTAPENGKVLVQKVTLIVGVYGLLRKAELLSLQWDNVTIGNDAVRITLRRKKQVGPAANSSFLITGEAFVNVLLRYADCFPLSVSQSFF